MSELPMFQEPLQMFPEQEGGFSESFIRECRKVFEERVQKMMDVFEKDAGFFDLSSSDYDEVKKFMKDEVEGIGQLYFLLMKTQMDFVKEQEKRVNQICGFTPQEDLKNLPGFVSAYKYGDQIDDSLDEFLKHYNECLKEIEVMMSLEELESVSYDKYKQNWREHVTAMETQSRISVRLILQQHTNAYNKEVNELIEKCSGLRATIMDITKIERDYQAITEEIKGKEERLEVLKQKFFNPNTVVAIESFVEEVNDLRISETRRRYTEQYRSWKDTVSDFNIACKSLYELEISVTCLSVNSSVDPTMIRSRCLSFEEQERTRSWTEKLSLMLKRCIQLSKEEMITLDKIGDLEED